MKQCSLYVCQRSNAKKLCCLLVNKLECKNNIKWKNLDFIFTGVYYKNEKYQTDKKYYRLSYLGPLHTRHFCSRYCDKEIFQHWHFLATDFYWPTKVRSYKNLVYLVLWFDKSLPWPVDIHGPKISFLSQYLFIAISFYRNIFLSQYCPSKCPVCISP